MAPSNEAPRSKSSNNPMRNVRAAATPSASSHVSSPPPYSVNPPQYSPARDERTPLLPSYGDSRKYHVSSAPERKKRITLPWLALLVTALVLAVVTIFTIVKPALEHAGGPPPPPHQEPRPPPINCSLAIIGGGPSGIAVAYALARKVATSRLNLNLNMTVIEQAGIGGRVVLTQSERVPEWTPFGTDLLSLIGPEEVAGPHLLNRSAFLQSHYRTLFGKFPESFEIGTRVGIHDGKTLLDDMLRPSKNTPWISWLGQIFKYGASVWRAPNVPDKTINKLNHISSLVNRFPFRTTGDLVNALGLSSEISSTGAQLLRSSGISSSYEANVILPETEKRFKQRPEHLTNLALSMALQEADKGSRYAGGRILPVLNNMLDSSGAQLSLRTQVTAIRHLELTPGKFQWVLQTQDQREEEYRAFDKLVLAAPLTEELEVDFGSDQAYSSRIVQYTDDHVTFFTSRSELNIDHLGDSEGGPRRLLMSATTVQEPLQGIREIAFIKDIVQVENHELVTDHLYRVFSNQRLSNVTLHYLLGSAEKMTWKHEKYIENAYPILIPGAPSSTFELHDSFWHTGGIESIGSSLDLSLAAGMNVASLVMESLQNLSATWD